MLELTLLNLVPALADQAGGKHHHEIVEVATDQDQGPEIGDEDPDPDLTIGDEDKR